ncbi:MAG: restriction endonuclease subunit S [Sulfurovum sp.]|nr:restriction endonuclease subunit S [Sulfurovum sp.]
MGKVREGYKWTKVGVIPEDWDVVKVNDVFIFIKTYSNSRADLSNQGDIEYLHYGDIHTKYKYHLDLNLNSLPKISSEKIKGNIEYVKDGDIFIADASEDYADIGKSIEAINVNNKKIISGLHTFLLRDKNNNFTSKYKGFIFYNENVSKNIKKIATGISVLGISKTNLGKLLIPLPPLKEQQKIAQILSTWDDAISKQEELIVAKERLKKGLMQRWIISDQWEMIKLDEILYEHKNKSNGKEEVYSVSVHKGLVNQIKHLGRSYSAKDTSNYNLVSPHDIVYTKSPTGDFPYGIIKENKTNKEVIVSPLYGVFSPKNKYVACILDAYFISYIRTNNYLRPLIQKGAKNTMSISNSTFLSRSIKFPKTEQEQQKIAQILTTADKEIELLKSELTAFKEQKRGLMQRLLTGEVRVKI